MLAAGALLFLAPQRSSAFSLALDSVATWGKFPRFCVNTYRWGDRFFNTYDTAYVVGTGYKFNVKYRMDTWLDNYIFQLPNDYRMKMASETNTSGGFYVTYLALSLGYDFDLNRLFGNRGTRRKRFNFRFNCALFSADLYWLRNDVGTSITSYGYPDHRVHCNVPFNGINTSIFGVDAYYFINNKRYARAAAFNYSKIQKISQGSWFAGFSYWTQSFEFDFIGLDPAIKETLPEGLDVFYINNHNYSVRGGYGYNWVLGRHWVIGISESPVIGLKHGTVNGSVPRVSLSLYNRAQASAVWNNRRWFAGFIFTAENGFYFDRKQSLLNGVFTAEGSVGYRFNLW